MNSLEKLDYALLAIYKSTRNGGMLAIIEAFRSNGQVLTKNEAETISKKLKNDGYAVYQLHNRGTDFRLQITDDGEYFVKNDSYSSRGTSILNL